MRKLFSFCQGFMIGGLVGAVVAIMLAPVSGDQARGELQERTIRLKDGIKEVAEARRAELERELNILRTPYQNK